MVIAVIAVLVAIVFVAVVTLALDPNAYGFAAVIATVVAIANVIFLTP